MSSCQIAYSSENGGFYIWQFGFDFLVKGHFSLSYDLKLSI
jgi:hypothetical protein